MKQSPATLPYVIRAFVVLGIVGSCLIVPACGGGGGNGTPGTPGAPGQPGLPTNPLPPDPKSAIVAAFMDPAISQDIPTYVKALIAANPDGVTLASGTVGSFPVPAATTDTIRTIPGLLHNVVVKWFDPLTLTVPGRVNLVNDALGTAGNTTSSENVANSNFTITSMTGGSATAASTGRIQVVHGFQLVDGDFFTLNDGVNPALKFEFDNNGGVAAGAVAVPFKTSWNVHRIAAAVVDAINKTGATLAISAYDEPLFGSHPDFLGYFGDGYNDPAAVPPGSVANPPQWNGSGNSAWLWSNHEYITSNEFPNFDPAVGLAPQGQELVLAKYMRERGLIDFDPTLDSNWDQAAVDFYIRTHKKQVGGSMMHIVRDPSTGEWFVDKSANNRRFDGTSTTRSLVTGQALNAAAHDDFGNALATGIVPGTFANCAGVVTPWGTVFSGEENTQDYYGDFEAWWDGNNQFVAGRGLDAGAAASPTFTASTTSLWGLTSDPNGRQNRDLYGYPIEIDPLRPPNEAYAIGGTGTGHRKMGSWGRARWENVCVAVDANWKLPNGAGKKLVMYGGDDRRGGRFFKWVSNGDVTSAMAADMVANKAAIRTLMDTGKLYVAHFQGVSNNNGWSQAGTTTPFTVGSKGNGKWIELSTTNVADDAPNAALLGAGIKVGAALQSNTWNNMGGFPDDNAVRRNDYTAANKIGIFEMNRPEEFAYNPAPPAGLGTNPLVIFSLTNFSGRPPALGKLGVMGEVDLTNDANGTAGNVALLETVANAGFLVQGMAGGTGGTKATGTLVCVRGDQIADGETLTIADGTNTVVFEFDKDGTVTGGRTAVAITNADPAQGVATKLIAAINGVTAGLTVTASGPTNDTAGRRADSVGRIWALDDGTTPESSTTFQFFEIFTGTSGSGLFDCANPDNIAITKDGSIWFGTDGNFGTNGRADAVYYLDTTRVHPTAANAQGRAFRILACPADAEHTGPCFSSDMKTLFNSIQHPGEFVESSWPNGQP